MTQQEIPEAATDEVLDYLDDLRESGKTNMLGAGVYLQNKFLFGQREASKVLGYWMDTYPRKDG